MNKQSEFIKEESHEKLVKENEEEKHKELKKELKRKRNRERQRAYYHRQKDLKKNEEKKKKKVPKTNAERQREFRQRIAEKSYVDMKRRKLCSNEENVVQALTMEDDIDIEEHDVLDNPKIRDIFPDLSLVKTEVPDTIEDIEEAVDEYYAPLQYPTEEHYGINIKKENTSDEDIIGCQYEQNNSAIVELGEIGPSNDDIPQSVLSTSQFGQSELASSQFGQSELAASQFGQSELAASQFGQSELNAYEYQENAISPYEFGQNESAPCEFAEDQQLHFNKIILGSKPASDYDTLYKEALHSNVSVYLENWEVRLNNSACYCNDCEILFPTVNALDAHKSISHSFLVALDTPRPNTARKSTTITSSRYCNHCNKMFSDDTALIKHLYELLPLNNFRKPTPEPLKIDAKSTRYKCIKCKKYFATFAAGKEHKKNHHPELTNVNIICKVLAKNEQLLDPVKKEHPEGKFFANESLVPKSVLFQCYVCQINFVSCYSATQHAVRCKNNTEYHKCKICKRKIRAKDNYIHTLQHRYAEPGAKLRIYTLQKYMSEKVYLKCPKCSICFDERTFWVHYGVCKNERVNFVRCRICSLDINQSRYPNHKSKHVMQKCTKKDFVIIKFYDTNRVNSVGIPKQFDEDFEPMQSEKKPIPEGEKIPLYYCNVCGSYKTYSTQRGHKNEACKTLSVKFCDLCGLGFSRENYKQHREHHNKRKLTLNDFKIINLKTGVEMEVQMSNFHSCKRCKIHFLSRERVQLHDCAKEQFEFCQICNKKFNLKAFVPHSNLHSNTNIPELLKKYNSINDMWNVVYLCVACDLVTMTYDSAVEHCQNHINEIQIPLVKRCDVCEFDIIEQYYRPHMQLHSNNVKINRTKFRVLTFNFEHLYSKQWMEMFSSLPQSHKYQILSKSIYRFSRLIKFNCEINCPSEDVKVFCKKCKTEVQLEDTKKHRFEKTCKSSTNYVCKICDLHFNSLRDFVYHKQEHDSLSKNYKVITFNDKKDEVFDQRLKDFELMTASNDPKIPSFSQTKSFKHSTKGFPIQASKLGKNLSKLKSICANTVREEVLRANRMKLYKCEKCGSCVSMLKNIAKHKCCMFGKTRLKLCYICKEYFYNRHLHLHMELHRQFPRLMKKPLVVRFNPKCDSWPVANIFQCECGLHFTSKQSIDNHLEICNDNLEISKEECSKCNLLFPTDVLVTHLCKHHSKPVDIRVQVISNKKPRPLKCADCSIIYSSVKSYDEHLFNCRASNGRTCSRCKLTFDSKTFSQHKCLINEKISVIKKSACVSVVYRCQSCDITYLNKKSISYHFERRHVTQRDIVTCDICKLKFTSQSYSRHTAHNNGDTYIIKIIEPMTGRSSILKGKNKSFKERAKSESDSKEEIETVVEAESIEMVNQENVSVNETDKVASCNYRVFRCHECKACYVVKKRLDRHLMLNHIAKPDHLECEVCGLTFQKKLMPRHMIIHQNDEPEYWIEVIDSDTGISTILNGKNFNPNKSDTSVNSNKRSSYFRDYNNLRSKRSRRNDDSIQNASDENLETQDQPSTSKFGLESVDMTEDYNERMLFDANDPLNSTESIFLDDGNLDDTKKSKTVAAHNIPEKLKIKLNANMRNYSSTLYKCKMCSLHFLTDGSILWHVSRKHNRQFPGYSCVVCGLNFTYATLQRHVYIHHKKMKLDKDSFNIKVIDENTTKITNEETPQQDQMIPQPNAHEESPDKNEEVIPPPNVDDNEMDASLQIDAKIHYYKCGDCNVCFIDDVTCREHCISHTSLDPKSYIECKICNFQFLIDSLKDHVNVHHIEEFFLEDLVITEYLSNGDDDPKVEVYQGIDKVQSRLVSTTTDVATDGCDTEIVGT